MLLTSPRRRRPLALAAALLVALAAPAALAQSTVQGVVTDARSGETIPGANVLVVGTTLGAATDVDGRYAIEGVPAGPQTLRVSFVGYTRAEVEVDVSGATVTADVALRPDAVGLDEVVVTGGGGTVEARRLSTTVESISPQQLAEIPAARLEDVLQANLANSQVRLSSGQPGTASLIRSRGVTSANLATTPVIYVDGVRVDNLNTASALDLASGGAQSSAIADIPVENIERIEFLKGGAATTLYGSDAANGVIQIFTKRGVAGQGTVDLETELGVVDGTRDFLRFQETADILYRPGLVQSYRLGASGGSEAVTYSFSGRALSDEGFRYGNESRRYDLRTTLSANVNPTTRYTGTYGYTNNAFERDFNANTSAAQFSNLENGDYGRLDTLSVGALDELRDDVRTIVDLLDFQYTTNRFQTSQQLRVLPLPTLTLQATAGVDYRVADTRRILTNAYNVAGGFAPPGTTDEGTIELSDRRSLGLTLEANATHTAETEIGGLPLSFLTIVGGQVFRTDDFQTATTATQVVEGSQSINNADEALSSDFALQVANYGVFFQENIGFRDNLFLDLGGRLDGNSAFGEDIGLVFYPKVGLAYTLSDEPFFARAVPTSVVSNLKLRASYGAAGNFPTPFANARTILVSPYGDLPAYRFDQPGATDLLPETVYTFEAGADVALNGGRLALEASYYNARTVDALFLAPFAPSSGQNDQLRNLGEIVNRGVELSANAFVVDTRDLTVRLNGSVNTLTNEVTDNGGTAAFNVGGFAFLGSFVDEGQPVGYFRGNRPVFADDGSVSVAAEPTMLGDTEVPAGGLLVERNADLGSPLPDVFGNLGLNLRYRNLTFLVSADYQAGSEGINVDDVLRFFGETTRIAGEIPAAERAELRAGYLAGDADAIARIAEIEGGAVDLTQGLVPARSLVLSAIGVPGYTFTNLAGAWVEPADYLKVRQISMSYRVPPRWIGGLARSARVQAAVINPFNVVASNFDPEVTGANGNSGNGDQNGVNVGGFGFATESPPRRYLLTLSLGL